MLHANLRSYFGANSKPTGPICKQDTGLFSQCTYDYFSFHSPAETKDDRPKVSYSIFDYLETSVQDKKSFAKDQAAFSGSKSVVKARLPQANIDAKTDVAAENATQDGNGAKQFESKTTVETSNSKIGESTSGFGKRLTVAELFLKESEKQLKESETNDPSVLTDTINQFDKMDLYKSIFLSDSEEETQNADQEKPADYNAFNEAPKNVERNLSPPRGIFANIDFDEINSWNRPPDPKPSENDSAKETTKASDTKEADLYGPRIPEKLLQKTERESDNMKVSFRSKSERDKDVQVISTSSSDSWVEASEERTKKLKKKKSKKHKSKHKKSKHKRKEK